MEETENCTVCNLKLDAVNYLKQRTVCKTCFYKTEDKNHN